MAEHPLRRVVIVIGLFNGAFWAWLLVHPGSQALTAAIADIVNAFGPLLGAGYFFWLVHPWQVGSLRRLNSVQRGASLLILGAVLFAFGQLIWSADEISLGRSAPFPSLADVGYILANACVITGVIFFPTRVTSRASRWRAMVDGMVVVAAVATFSWQFVLGPVFFQRNASVLAKLVAAAYPASGLLLVVCLVGLTLHSHAAVVRRVAPVLSAGLAVLIAADSMYAYQAMKGMHATGGPVDPAWALGWMLIAVAAVKAWTIRGVGQRSEPEVILASRSTLGQVWPRFVPYSLVPPVAILAVWVAQSSEIPSLKAGVYACAFLVFMLLAVHQVLVILENVDATMRMQAAWALAIEEQALRKSESRFRTLIQDMQVGVLVVSAEGRITMSNPAASRLIGGSRVDLTGDEVFRGERDVVREDGTPVPTIQQPITIALRAKRAVLDTVLGVVRRDTDETAWLLVNAIPQFRLNGSVEHVLCTYIDITPLQRAEQALRRDAEQLSAIIATQRDIAMTRLDLDAVMAVVAERAAELTGAQSAVVGMVEGEAIVVRAASRSFQKHTGMTIPLAGTLVGLCVSSGELQVVDDTESDPRVNNQLSRQLEARSLVAVPLHHDRVVIGVLVVQSAETSSFGERDVNTLQLMAGLIGAAVSNAAEFEAKQQLLTERTAALKQVEYQALHDGLTDLPNRTLLHDRLAQAIHGAHRDQQPMALLLMDLDRFKDVNDTFGHHYGDLLLKEIGARLDSTLRESDTIARLGGDEFALLLPGTDDVGATCTARKILSALSAPYDLDGQHLVVDASIGISLYPQHGEDASMLLQRADIAMYVAKRTSIGYAIYSPDQDENSPARLRLVADLRAAIGSDALDLNYQWKLDLRSGTFDSVEALVRWLHPEHGYLSPGQFIALAEQTGLIQALSPWVLSAALAQRRQWLQQGHRIRVAVNLSARNLHDPQLLPTVQSMLRATGDTTGALAVEITESAIMLDPIRARAALEELHNMGVRIAIDDFGTGYSSLAYLRDLPVDEIKIDKSFVLGMAHNPGDAVIVRSIVDLGHNLGLEVVAEGVENRETLLLLKAMGCDLAQGHFLGSPMEASKVTDRLHDTIPGVAEVRAFGR